MRIIFIGAVIASLTGCGVVLPDVVVMGTEQGIRAYNDGQAALIAQSKTQHRNGDTPYWHTRQAQAGYSFWERLSRGLIATSETSKQGQEAAHDAQ